MEKGPLTTDEDKYLRKIYYNPRNPGSYGGIDRLHRQVKKEASMNISKGRIKRWLAEQDVYTKFRPSRTKFPRIPIYASSIGYMWEADLADMNNYKKENNGNAYFLLCIDAFSKKIWTKPLKTKSGKEVAEAFEQIFSKTKPPQKLRTDKGTEFTNVYVQKIFNKYNIEFFTTQNETKSAIAERGIKTIKGRIMKIINASHSYVWIDDIQDVTESYNNSIHSSTKKIPNEVSEKDQAEIWDNLYEELPKHKDSDEKEKTLSTEPDIKLKDEIIKKEKKMNKKKKKKYIKNYKFKIGDQVRVSVLKGKFDREYSQKFTDEVFEIYDRFKRGDIAMYRIRDQNREPIKGVWYTQELQRVFVSPDKLWEIEKIVDTKTEGRGNKKRHMSLVKWNGWPKRFNTWIPTKEIQDVENPKQSTNHESGYKTNV